jgi:hydrogenase small subunit
LRLTRAEFLKLCTATAAGASLVKFTGFGGQEALAKEALALLTDDGKPPVIWLQGASCTGCSVSLLNSVDPPIEKALLDIISLRYHPNLSAAQGELIPEIFAEVAEQYKDKFILVVEGAIPLKDDGIYCTITEERNGTPVTILSAVNKLGNAAKAVIAAGQCASYGGIPGADPNPTGVVGVDQVIKNKPVINLSLCPMQPDHFLGTVTYLLKNGTIPELDRHGRPKMFFPGPIHDACERRKLFDQGKFAQKIGDEGCLSLLGCKGFISMADCATRNWNNKVNWCVRAGAPCLGCSEPLFPDDSSPFYGSYQLNNKQDVTFNKIVPQKNTEFVEHAKKS